MSEPAAPLRKTDCAECMALLDSFMDIPETLKRTRAVWATQECQGNHVVDEWLQEIPRKVSSGE